VTSDVLPDPNTAFGERVRRRLREGRAIWFTTVGADGTPQPNPVWFVWDDGGILIYNRPDAKRLAHIRRDPHVSLHFDGDGRGGEVIVLTGRAGIVEDSPLPHENPNYLGKYRDHMTRVSGSAEGFSSGYPVAVRVDVARVRGF
jgi:PPOX class probable F420-dependent enzyme